MRLRSMVLPSPARTGSQEGPYSEFIICIPKKCYTSITSISFGFCSSRERARPRRLFSRVFPSLRSGGIPLDDSDRSWQHRSAIVGLLSPVRSCAVPTRTTPDFFGFPHRQGTLVEGLGDSGCLTILGGKLPLSDARGSEAEGV
jgi:hypothetical protein